MTDASQTYAFTAQTIKNTKKQTNKKNKKYKNKTTKNKDFDTKKKATCWQWIMDYNGLP